ncbi:MAG: GMC family oxidoreductase [Campylobacterales bacterium]|nr:GMC family oxidoreductase [Campylobacterales bacterium]
MKIYDALIIGSGASGGAVAYTLTQAGFDVAMVEKGKLINREEFSKDELAYCRRDIITPNLFDEYHIIEEEIDGKWVSTPTYESGWSFWNGSLVGGSSNLMSGMFHRLHPDDFRLLSKYGQIGDANVADWPISYDELEPYYTLVEELVGISGKVIPHPFEPPRSTRDFPQPPTKENEVVKLFEKSCKGLGISPLVTPRAVLSKDKGYRQACYYSNFCGSYGCSSGAKGSSREAFIIPALATGNLTLMTKTHVKSLESGKDEVHCAVVVDTVTGKEKKIYAKLFIVAAQAHESVRLLLNSANGYHPKGLANSSGELGKNLIFSAGGSGQGELHADNLKEITFDALMQRGLFVNRSVLDWYFIDDWWSGRFKGGSVEFMFEHQNIISRARKHTEDKEGKMLWGDALAKRLLKRFRQTKSIRFEIFTDWLPHDDCFISVDPDHKDKHGMPVGKLRIKGHPHDLKVGHYIAKYCEKILEEMGAKNIYSSISAAPPQNLIAGGCRFGDDPQKSVLNKYCRSHDIQNLFVADASFMPTGGSVAYTWTIYANALRVADHIVKRFSHLASRKI